MFDVYVDIKRLQRLQGHVDLSKLPYAVVDHLLVIDETVTKFIETNHDSQGKT